MFCSKCGAAKQEEEFCKICGQSLQPSAKRANPPLVIAIAALMIALIGTGFGVLFYLQTLEEAAKSSCRN